MKEESRVDPEWAAEREVPTGVGEAGWPWDMGWLGGHRSSPGPEL